MDAPKQRVKENILLVDDQPGKLLSYETILEDLDENLLKASSAKEAFELLLKNDVAVILVDVCMPDLDGFQLAQMIREHPRYERTAIIFISAVQVTEIDSLKGYEMGAVDYVPVPVVAGVLRAKVRVFVDLHRKSRELERLNENLERRVSERTAELETAIERQELLAREVDHRARNALAVIQAIVSLTPGHSINEYSAAVRGRIQAMARAHTLLSETRWRGADLGRIMREELEPFRADDRVVIKGADIAILPSVAQNLALAIHELVTNAVKYGALSTPLGKLEVTWSLENDELALHWREVGGPPVSAPKKGGFGTRVIESSVRGQLGGNYEMDWREDGLRCLMRLPGKHFSMQVAPEIAEAAGSDEVDSPPVSLEGRRVLVLDDEPLVAMLLSDTLRELGATVIGPFGKIADARKALHEKFDAAILDVNINGEMIFPFAAELRDRGVPIAFVTGYESESVAAQFQGAYSITKPIELDSIAGVLSALLTDKGAQRRAVAS